jgi:hypothetical protein
MHHPKPIRLLSTLARSMAGIVITFYDTDRATVRA